MLKVKVDENSKRGTYTALGYKVVSTLRREGSFPSGGSGALNVQYDREPLINQSRQFSRDNDIYQGMIRRSASYIVGRGFTNQPNTKSAAWNKKADALWREYWKRPEIKQIQSGPQIEKMLCKEVMLCGDTGVLKLNDGQIQLFESEQIVSKRRSGNGVEMDEFMRPSGYWVAPYVNGRVANSKALKRPVEDFLFLTTAERPSQVRGVPVCEASFPNLHRIKDVVDSEALAWQMLARMGLSITRPGAASSAYSESITDDAPKATEGADEVRVTELDYALIFHGEHGDEIKGIDRNIPGKNFPESLRTFLRLLGLPLGLPLELILLDWTQSNYSQSRAVLEQAYQTFRDWQELLESFALSPIYEWKIRQWIKDGRLTARKDALRHEWIKPTFPWIDQLKEAQAYGEKVDRGFATHAQVCKALHTDRDDVVAARSREITEAIEIAKKIEGDTGVAVSWQQFAGTGMPKEAPQDNDDEKDVDDAKPNSDE